MKKLLAVILVSVVGLFANDIVIKESSCSVEKTVDNLKHIIQNKGLTLFSVVNHQQNAQGVGMKMAESQLVIFGNPKLGTSLMNEDIRVGLDLPLKILVYKDESKVKLAYRNGSYLAKEHSLNIPKREKKMNGALDKITTKAGQCKKD
jgi:uncharacterized protein (DUF302 family)